MSSYQRPPLYPKQAAFVDSTARYTVVEASTKSGKTYACIVWIFERAAQGKPGQHFWWVAPVYDQSRIAWERMAQYLPAPIRQPRQSPLQIVLGNGTVIDFKSADDDQHLFGQDVYAAVIDEASRVKETSWHAIRSTLTATRGPVKIIGNVRGRRNWAYRMGEEARTNTHPDLAYFKLTAHDAIEAGVLDPEEIEDAKRTLPEHVFRELYLAEPSDDGGNPFGLTTVRECVVDSLSTGEPVVWGWDLAKHQDYTVGIALDATADVCRIERVQFDWRATKAFILAVTNGRPALVDSTGVGDPVLEDLQSGGGQFEGFHFTGPSKQQLMEGLATVIHQRAIHFPDKGYELVPELEAFEYEPILSNGRVTGVRYAAPPGRHDDCVCALALAVHHKRQLAVSQAPLVWFQGVDQPDGWDPFGNL